MATRFKEASFPPAFKWGDVKETPAPAGETEPETLSSARKQLKHPRNSSLSYMPALDGLRALAVLAVLAYHADLPWARAGFLGVDVFFVISGYLITALLLSEHTRNGRVSLRRFWGRRALRLLPGLLVMLAAVCVAVPLLAPDQNESLNGDLGAALTYVSNWWLIFQDKPYFEAIGRPPLLQHLWSLAVEEQFYLLWPLALAFGLRKPLRSPRKLVKWILLAIAGSALAMALMYDPEGDASRVYYGTDTRVGTILLGAALAFIWSPGHRTATPRRVGSFMRDAAALASLAVLGWLVVNWHEFEPMLYRGGFTLVALLSVIVVSVASHPGLLTRGLLGNPAMTWLGRRSYSIYLWHWPVFMLTRPDLDVSLSGLPLLALRLSLTLALAVASYALVEKPVRDGALGHAWKKLRSGLSTRSFGKATAGMACLSLPVILCGAVIATAAIPRNAPDPPAEAILAGAGQIAAAADPPPPISDLESSQLVVPEEPAAAAPPPEEPVAPITPPGKVTAVGDSVMLIARDALSARFGGGLVDAAIGRQTRDVIQSVQEIKDRGELGDGVVIHMGTNGLITVRQFDQLMDILKDVPQVSVVNVKVARPWEEINNRMLAENIGRFPNAKLVDWKGTASAHPEAFYNDGVHLKPSGIGMYVDLLSGSITG